jgi:hypothetical protein
VEITGNVMSNTNIVSVGEIMLLLMWRLGRFCEAGSYLLLLGQLHYKAIIAAA